jgi:3-phosphoglycerate kinase
MAQTLFYAIVGAYKDPKTNSGLKSGHFFDFLSNSYIYQPCYESGEDKKLERTYSMISKFNEIRVPFIENMFSKCIEVLNIKLQNNEIVTLKNILNVYSDKRRHPSNQISLLKNI